MNRLFLIIISIVFVSCSEKPTLQKYFVEKSEKKEFVSLDLSSSILNTNKVNLSSSEKDALNSFEKINVLAFKKEEANEKEYLSEIQKIKGILKDEKVYNELMKVGSGKDGGAVYFVGEDEHIDEFVLFANKKENGFAVIRVLGKDMNATNVLNMISVISKSDVNLEQLKPLQELVTK